MPGGFRELEYVTADLGIEAWGTDLNTAFASAAVGLASLMSDVPHLDQPQTRNIHVKSPSLASLFIRFLNEIIYLEETEGFLPGSVTNLRIKGADLYATLAGAIFNPDDHTMDAHIKAATYHGLEINETGEGVIIKVIFDV